MSVKIETTLSVATTAVRAANADLRYQLALHGECPYVVEDAQTAVEDAEELLASFTRAAKKGLRPLVLEVARNTPVSLVVPTTCGTLFGAECAWDQEATLTAFRSLLGRTETRTERRAVSALFDATQEKSNRR